MDTGDAVERDGDWFGASVDTAARISGVPAGGEMLLSEVTRDAAGAIGGSRASPPGSAIASQCPRPVVL